MNNWDLNRLYKTKSEWEEDYKALEGMLDKAQDFKGNLASEEVLDEFFSYNETLENLFVHVFYYVYFQYSLNSKDVEIQEMLGKMTAIESRFSEEFSYVENELLEEDYDLYEEYAKSSKLIREHLFEIQRIFHNKEHILSTKEEKLLSQFQISLQGYSKLYEDLSSADREAVQVTLSTGEKLDITDINYTSYLETLENQDDRRIVFEAVFKYYEAHKNTYASIYNGIVQTNIAQTKARNYDHFLDTFLFSNNIPREVFLTLVSSASKTVAPLKRYLQLRKKVLGVDTYHSYDRFRPLAKSDKKYSYEEAKELFYDSIKFLGEDYVSHAKRALEDGRVDVYPKTGKRGGAYSAGAKDAGPFILLNHNGVLGDVFTLAHECGHSIHTLYSNENQPNATKEYKIFVAEIASTFNEHVLCDYMINNSTDIDEKIVLLENKINSLVGTYYRQTVFAEYEYEAHKIVAEGGSLNHANLSAIMISLYKKYYDIDLNGEPFKQYVWAYIPHIFETPFYVYQYATSFTASMKLYNDVYNKVPQAFERHISLLKSGGSNYPIDLVLASGVDLRSEDTYMAVSDYMDRLVTELEDLVKQKYNM